MRMSVPFLSYFSASSLDTYVLGGGLYCYILMTFLKQFRDVSYSIYCTLYCINVFNLQLHHNINFIRNTCKEEADARNFSIENEMVSV
jgi:hypothetical protein